MYVPAWPLPLASAAVVPEASPSRQYEAGLSAVTALAYATDVTGPCCNLDRRALTGQPFPKGSGQGSSSLPAVPHTGACPPIMASYVYSAYTYGDVGQLGSTAIP